MLNKKILNKYKGFINIMKTINEVLKVENLHVCFFKKEKEIHVLNGLDFSLREGEALGILGESGSGKTVLAKAILNVITPPGKIIQGSIYYRNQVGLVDLIEKEEKELQSLRGKYLAMIPSSPHDWLNPLENVGTQMMNAIFAHKNISKIECFERSEKMLEEVRIPDPKKRMFAYPHELSGGMAQRVLIGMALLNEPQVIIADNPTFGLDVTTQIQIMNLLHQLLSFRGSCLLMNTTNVGLITHYCDKIAVMYHGKIIEYADIDSFLEGPNHPYSTMLLVADTLEVRGKSLQIEKSEKLDISNLPKGCYFQNICKMSTKSCADHSPELNEISKKHLIRCHYLESI